MKLMRLFIPLVTMLMLAGCSPLSSSLEKEPVENTSHLTIGNSLEIENTDSRLVLVDNNSVLAADGLYYVSWGIGDAEPYENSAGETADLYDASLYLLLGESGNQASAQKNAAAWLEAAKTNYEILEESEITCNGQPYTMLTYNCIDTDNPYARGVSVFGSFGCSSVCIELTCRESYSEDLTSILTDFLNNCSYTVD